MATLKFTSHTDNTVSFADTGGIVTQDTDLDPTGKTIGYDTTYITIVGGSAQTADAALAVDGGFLYATFNSTDGGKTWSGTVTGGTGKFKGATGTVTAEATGPTDLAVVADYST